ncbi:MAG: PEGA domain-containing protein [Myxococcota bacterium]|nr:PEGA domain-containing protein [Myxococcota bacterium]
MARKINFSVLEPKTTCILALCFIHCCIVGPVFADDQLTQQARIKFEEGTRSVRERDYQNALQAFQDSYQLRPKPLVLYNAAMCQKALFRYVEAANSLRKCLDNLEDTPSDRHIRALAQQALKEIEDKIGTLILKGIPKGASVIIDGVPQRDKAIGHPLQMDPGHHQVTVSAPNRQDFKDTITIQPSQVLRLVVFLPLLPAELVIESGTKDAKIYVNDQHVGSGNFRGEFDVGPVEVKVTSKGKKDHRETLVLHPGQLSIVNAMLEPKMPAATLLVMPTHTNSSQKPLTDRENIIFAGSIGAMALGILSVGIGVGYTIKGSRDFQAGKQAGENYELHGDLAEYDRWLKIKNETLPADKKGLTIGYSIGATLITSGVLLLLQSRILGKRQRDKMSVITGVDGLSVRF